MMPSRGCPGSYDFWTSSSSIWQLCVLYMIFLSISYVHFSRLPEENITDVETFLETTLVNQSVPDNGTLSPPVVLAPEAMGRVPVRTEQLLPDGTLHSSSPSPEDPSLPTPPRQPVSSTSETPKKNDSDAPHDDIPSFSEWANKKMAEVEKNKGENLTISNTKIRLKNYASPDCGAKVLAANPEATSPSAILSPSRDDYMLNPCNVKIWFAVELCESIQPQRIEVANFELFSSSPKDLSVWVSDRYPTRDWTQVAVLQAKDEKNVQSFPLPRLPHFAKYVKVELHSHYGSEHYCPVSLFKAFGTSELEVLDNADNDDDGDEGSQDSRLNINDEDDDSVEGSQDAPKGPPEDKKPKNDLFRTAKNAVLSIVEKAAAVLGNGKARNNTCLNVTTSSQCMTPGYQIVCNNCSDHFYDRLYELMCCDGKKLNDLLSNQFVYSVITESALCSSFGIDLLPGQENSSISNRAISVSYLRAFLGDNTLAALCNYLAISWKKIALNVSEQEKAKADESPHEESSVDKKDAAEELPTLKPTESTIIETNVTEDEPKISIIPTKTLPAEITQEANTSDPSTSMPAESDGELPTGRVVEPMNSTVPVEHDITFPDQSPINERAPTGLSEPEPLPPPPVESAQTPVTGPDDSTNVDQFALDSLFPELEEETMPTSSETAAKATAINSPPIQQKESVFVRLANRIKALEVNMSLSSQYLEELSRRYKKQVEELQRALGNVVEDRRLAAEREKSQAAQISHLTQKVEALTAAVTQILEERNHWAPKAYVYGQHGVIILAEVVVLFLVLGLCRWLVGQTKVPQDPVHVPLPQRRHSLDGPPAGAAQPKQRRPSEEALVPSSSTHQELLIDAPKRKTSKDGKQKRKRRRKERSDEMVAVLSAEGEELEIAAPEFIRTAESNRQQRMSIQTQTSSSQETVGSTATVAGNAVTIKKKTGALKKIVKKLF
ncbi:Sad1 / UNC-like C-terminal [Nesidiocoris tenuis]|uniref:Sad1 / UNC-like C-terminal n=2 Tax=Nesidiocoris tenuis TaxID=355587 RepID=A0ABN7AAI8_9HEMI|nr:Sad1 / UNC-like C-terminal [Nesidiocoris tenuis]